MYASNYMYPLSLFLALFIQYDEFRTSDPLQRRGRAGRGKTLTNCPKIWVTLDRKKALAGCIEGKKGSFQRPIGRQQEECGSRSTKDDNGRGILLPRIPATGAAPFLNVRRIC